MHGGLKTGDRRIMFWGLWIFLPRSAVFCIFLVWLKKNRVWWWSPGWGKVGMNNRCVLLHYIVLMACCILFRMRGGRQMPFFSLLLRRKGSCANSSWTLLLTFLPWSFPIMKRGETQSWGSLTVQKDHRVQLLIAASLYSPICDFSPEQSPSLLESPQPYCLQRCVAWQWDAMEKRHSQLSSLLMSSLPSNPHFGMRAKLVSLVCQ